jgi:cell division protein FtsL
LIRPHINTAYLGRRSKSRLPKSKSQCTEVINDRWQRFGRDFEQICWFSAKNAESVKLRTEVLHLRTEVLHLRTEVLHLRTEVLHLRTEVLHLRTEVLHLRTEVLHLRMEVLHLRTEVLHLRTEVLRLRTEVLHLRMEVSQVRVAVSQVRGGVSSSFNIPKTKRAEGIAPSAAIAFINLPTLTSCRSPRSPAAIAQHCQPHSSPAKTHGLAGTGRPDVDSATADLSPSVSHQILAGIAGVFQSHPGPQR